MNLDEIKKLHATGNYICVSKHESNDVWFDIADRRIIEGYGYEYKLIHKKHKDVLDHVFSGGKVKVEVGFMQYEPIDDFFRQYNEKATYDIIAKDKFDVGLKMGEEIKNRKQFKDCNLEKTYVKADEATFEVLKCRGIAYSNDYDNQWYWYYSDMNGKIIGRYKSGAYIDERTQIYYNVEHDYFTDVEPKGDGDTTCKQCGHTLHGADCPLCGEEIINPQKGWTNTRIEPTQLHADMTLDDLPLTSEEHNTDGSATSFYDIPEWVTNLDKLTSYLNLNAFEFNILKSIWGRLGDRHSGTNATRDGNKELHYAKELVEHLERKIKEK